MNSSPSLSYPRPKLEILRTTLPPRSRTVPSSIDQAQLSPSVTLISMNSSPSLSYPRPKLKILRTTLPPRSRTVPSSRPHRPFLQPNLLLLLSHRPALPRLALPSANGNAASRLDADDLPEGISRRRRPTAAAAAAKRPLEASGGDDGGRERVLRGIIVRVGDVLSMAFPLFAGSACALALWRPSSFLWAHKDWQILGLALSMLGMGMTLTLQDLSGALLMPKELATGFVLQYTVMPLSGFFISKLLKLPSHYAAGLILVASCPGGTASNIVTYIARGNVALSVLMTAASTITAVIMTPFFVSKLAGQFVAVDPIGLCISTGQVVLAPVLLGALLNQYCNSLVELLSPFMPLIVLGSVTILCGSVVATNASSILASGLQVLLSVCCLHASGFFFGYVLSRMLGIDVSTSRTISIQVGMQNGVLGIVLASQHFGNPLTVVPSAISSVCHLAYGSLLAGIWRCMPPKTEVKD